MNGDGSDLFFIPQMAFNLLLQQTLNDSSPAS
jgi:hypothetical protein